MMFCDEYELAIRLRVAVVVARDRGTPVRTIGVERLRVSGPSGHPWGGLLVVADMFGAPVAPAMPAANEGP